MTPDAFKSLIADLTRTLQGRPLDADLARALNEVECPAGSARFQALADACQAGVAAGWMCKYEAGGLRYGRIIKPGPDTHGFSVDVVDMADVAGPHHVHPNGEIDLVMPLDAEARFDGQGAGWTVYGPGSAHRPTVTGGRALVLYLLPEGAITFTGA